MARRKKRSEDFWVSVISAPFLLYIFYMIVRSLCSSNKDFCFLGYVIWIVTLIGYIVYVVEGVRRKYG
jgi:hypothetical protein